MGGVFEAVFRTVGEALRDIPMSVHIGVGVVFMIGLIVWAFGRHLLKPMLVLIAIAWGAGVGLVVAAFLPWDISPWWPIGLTAGFFGVVTIGSYRPVMAVMLAVALGLAAPLAFFTYAELTGKYDHLAADQPEGDDLLLPNIPGLGDPGLREQIKTGGEKAIDAADRAADWLDRTDEGAAGGDSDADKATGGEDSATDGGEPVHWRKTVNRMLRSAGQTAAVIWKDSPTAQKVAMLLASLGGIVGGFLIGLLMPKLASTVVTSLAGSLLFLTSGSWLIAWAGFPPTKLGAGSALGVLIWWLTATLIGVVIQMTRKKRKKAEAE